MNLFIFEFWDVNQNLIPYLRQMVLAYVSIEGWIVHPDVYSLFNGSEVCGEGGPKLDITSVYRTLVITSTNAQEQRQYHLP